MDTEAKRREDAMLKISYRDHGKIKFHASVTTGSSPAALKLGY